MTKPKTNNETLKYIGLSTQLLVTIGLAVWGGIELDKIVPMKFPLFLILLPILALVVSFWNLMRTLNNKGK